MVSEVDRRLEILEMPAALGISIREACRQKGISPATYYDWARRREAGGVAGLAPRSRRPWSSPRSLDPMVEDEICALRAEHDDWGPLRIHGELRRAGVEPPSVTTIKRVLQRNGFIVREPLSPKPTPIRFERPSPNELWQTDATDMRLDDGTVVWVLNVLDDCARMLLASIVVPVVDANAAWAAMNAAIARYGRPREVLSDNGTYFTGRLRGAVSIFERRLWNRGIATTHSRPSHPQTCGKEERLHRTQKLWLADNGPINNLAEMQAGLDAFAHHYNHERPHQGLDNEIPAERFARLERVGPDPDRTVAHHTTRRVDSTGQVSYAGWRVNVGSPLAGETVEVIDDGHKVRLLLGDDQLHAFAADLPRGYVASGRPRGRRPRNFA